MKPDAELRSYATQRELDYLEAIDKCGSQRAAARSLKVTQRTVWSAMKRLKVRAALMGHSPEHDMTHTVPQGFTVRGVSTYYDEEGKPRGQWVKSAADDKQREEMLREFALSLGEEVKGLAKAVKPPVVSEADLMCVIPIGDPHFGMYAWAQDAGDDFDLDLAESLTKQAIDRLIAAAPSAIVGVLLNLGDMYHADNQSNVTKSGHQLDVDGRWAKVQQRGLLTMVYCLKRMLEKFSKVVFRINKGNHDGHSSYALALMLSCYFHGEPRIEVDLSPSPVWYYKFGRVLLGSTHGDTIKGRDMLAIMAADKPQDWGDSAHRYWYVGHVHHHDSKEYPGGIVEYFRTLAPGDAWHHGQGYRSGRDIHLVVQHQEFGEIERHRVDVRMLV